MSKTKTNTAKTIENTTVHSTVNINFDDDFGVKVEEAILIHTQTLNNLVNKLGDKITVAGIFIEDGSSK